MPELPEVETIRNQLTETLPLDVVSASFSKVAGSIVKKRVFSARGKRLLRIDRIGKVLDFIFNGDLHLISRLGMSGSWRISSEKIVAKHTHVQFRCVNESDENVYLGYVDPRRFGSINFLKADEAAEMLGKLGVDVSSAAFTPAYIRQVFAKHPKWELKPLLLEQKYFAGIGNYIASEICALAGILPTRKVQDISSGECRKIKNGCKKVIDQSIKSNGMTFHGGYLDANGEKGEGVQNLVVFNQELCQLCKKNSVSKIYQKGRGSYYCSKCQK